MSNSIRLSPKHGVNPTIPVCAWCGEPKNETALLGKIKTNKRGEDPEAPKHCILDYEPCEKCAEKFSKGVVCIEAKTEPVVENQPPITEIDGQEIYPTSRWGVVSVEFANQVFPGEFKCGSKICLEDTLFEEMFRGVGDAEES